MFNNIAHTLHSFFRHRTTPDLIFLFCLLTVENITSGAFSAASLYLIKFLIHGDVVATSSFEFKPIDDTIFSTGFAFVISQFFLVACPLIGIYSDQVGRKKCLIFATSCSIFGCGLIGIGLYWNSLILVIFGLLLQSMSNMGFPILLAAISDIKHRMHKIYYYSFVQIVMLWVLISAGFVNYLLSNHRLLLSFFIKIFFYIALIELFNLVFTVIFMKETVPKSTRNKIVNIEIVAEAVFSVFSKKHFIYIFSLLFLTYFLWGVYFQHIFQYLRDSLHWPPESIDLFRYSMLLLIFIGSIFVPILTSMFKLRQILAIGLILLGFSSIIWYFLPFSMSQWAILIIISLSAALTIPILWQFLFEISSFSKNGFISSLIATFWPVAWIASNALRLVVPKKMVYYPHFLSFVTGTLLFILIKSFLFKRGKSNTGVLQHDE